MADELAEVIGLDEVNRMLDEAPKEIVIHGYLKALQAAGEVIAAAVEARTPERDEGERDENVAHLKDSIVVQVTLDSNANGGTVDVGFGKLGYKARFLELGHNSLGHKPDKKLLGNVSPHPFMRPAAAACADEAIAAVAAVIEDTVRSQFPQGEI